MSVSGVDETANSRVWPELPSATGPVYVTLTESSGVYDRRVLQVACLVGFSAGGELTPCDAPPHSPVSDGAGGSLRTSRR